jgi:N-acetylglucosaminyldiphosphoundecaprenol N-acetyl-beta-D-mannosaminyltransferase
MGCRLQNTMQLGGVSHPRCNVLGVRISATNMDEAVRLSDWQIHTGGRGYICVTGVHGVMEAQSDLDFRSILNQSFITTPDGMPTVWVGRAQGHSKMSRVYGPDYMLRMCELSLTRDYRHFLYGGNSGVAERLAQNLSRRYPGLQIVGTYTPPFRALNASEERELLHRLENTKPHILWIGLSTPKQERFMADYFERLNVSLMIGVGAAFDIHSGGIADAPAWMKNAGLQWLHRLIQEPKRLGKRYLVNNPKFIWNIALQLSGIRNFDSES